MPDPQPELTRLRAQQIVLVGAMTKGISAMEKHNTERTSLNTCGWDFGDGFGGVLDIMRKALATLDVPPEKR